TGDPSGGGSSGLFAYASSRAATGPTPPLHRRRRTGHSDHLGCTPAADSGRRSPAWIDTEAACGHRAMADPDDCLAILLLGSPRARCRGRSTVFDESALTVANLGRSICLGPFDPRVHGAKGQLLLAVGEREEQLEDVAAGTWTTLWKGCRGRTSSARRAE